MIIVGAELGAEDGIRPGMLASASGAARLRQAEMVGVRLAITNLSQQIQSTIARPGNGVFGRSGTHALAGKRTELDVGIPLLADPQEKSRIEDGAQGEVTVEAVPSMGRAARLRPIISAGPMAYRTGVRRHPRINRDLLCSRSF
ncbi:hypothetical protein [Nocardia sp. NPDC049149]|uniref:hypothetical protein n=1 Tax=Nocardia sp. NPDC049149 TaxID=3364315 RepID=UPI0037168FA4